jgi:hypothetical protein
MKRQGMPIILNKKITQQRVVPDIARALPSVARLIAQAGIEGPVLEQRVGCLLPRVIFFTRAFNFAVTLHSHFQRGCSHCQHCFRHHGASEPLPLRPVCVCWKLTAHVLCHHRKPSRECFKKSFTTLEAYINLFGGHVQYFEVS